MAKNFNTYAEKKLNAEDRRRVKQRADQLWLGMRLAELREQQGMTQKELAEKVGITQPSLCRMEKQGDMQVTTLQRLIKALGGTLEVSATFSKPKRKKPASRKTARSGRPTQRLQLV